MALRADAVDLPGRSRLWPACLALIALSGAVYAGLYRNEFVNFDDPIYITDNAYTQAGLTFNSQKYAWRTFDLGNWMPLTWTSLQLSASLCGASPRCFLGGNLLLHALGVVLVFLVWNEWTGRRGASFALAALFAAHPLHVESVAWASERKDVLCQFFLLLTLWAYGRYARAPGPGGYLLTSAAFALSLLSKPMAVTLPVLLLLADYWPLERHAGGTSGRAGRSWRWLALEKAPWLALSLAIGVVTILAQESSRAMQLQERIPLSCRLGVAVESLGWYLTTTLWPTGLSIMHVHPERDLNWFAVGVSAAVLAAVSAYVAAFGRLRKHLVFGWLWFLIALLPVLGLLQVGVQARADRYAYLPHVGLLTLLVWEFAAVAEKLSLRREVRVCVAAATIGVAAWLSAQQVSVWRNSTTLWSHALAVDPDNWVARYMLGYSLYETGDFDAADALFQQVLEQRPQLADVYASLAMVALKRGDQAGAAAISQLQVERLPEDPQAWFNHASFEMLQGDLPAAEQAFLRALTLDPRRPQWWNDLGQTLAAQGKHREALAAFRRILQLRRYDPGAYYNVAMMLGELERFDEARAALERSLAIDSEQAPAHYRLGILLRESGRAAEARYHFDQARRIDPQLTPDE